jgi:translation initiation factor IF-1
MTRCILHSHEYYQLLGTLTKTSISKMPQEDIQDMKCSKKTRQIAYTSNRMKRKEIRIN